MHISRLEAYSHSWWSYHTSLYNCVCVCSEVYIVCTYVRHNYPPPFPLLSTNVLYTVYCIYSVHLFIISAIPSQCSLQLCAQTVFMKAPLFSLYMYVYHSDTPTLPYPTPNIICSACFVKKIRL